jgi:hypothetical protein
VGDVRAGDSASALALPSARHRRSPVIGNGKKFSVFTRAARAAGMPSMLGTSDCFLCAHSISKRDVTVSIPRLGIKAHLPCYERDLGGDDPTALRLFGTRDNSPGSRRPDDARREAI